MCGNKIKIEWLISEIIKNTDQNKVVNTDQNRQAPIPTTTKYSGYRECQRLAPEFIQFNSTMHNLGYKTTITYQQFKT
jgi:hypothetical protein